MKTFNEIKAGDTIWTVDWGYMGFLICPVVPTIRVSSYVVKEIFIGENCVAFTTKGLVCGALRIGKALMRKESAHQGELAKSYFAGQSYLFWEYMRLMKETKPKYFLLENVNMADKWKDIITENLGVEPIMINSRLVSAQNRVRLYWTNIPGVSMPEDKEVRLVDILEDKSYTNPGAIRGRHKPTIQCLEVRDSYRDKSNCLTTVEKDNVLTPLSPGRYEDAYGKISGNKLPFRYYTRLEYERLQTLPDHYTEPMGDSAAKKAIGNGWTVDVIAHIFRGISEQTK